MHRGQQFATEQSVMEKTGDLCVINFFCWHLFLFSYGTHQDLV